MALPALVADVVTSSRRARLLAIQSAFAAVALSGCGGGGGGSETANTPPPPAPVEQPSTAELAALGRRIQDCLALPVAQRVTLDGSGTVTAVSSTCDFAVADWRSGGRNWREEVGQNTLAKNQLTGATVGAGQIAFTDPGAGLTDPKEFKHPYCNSAACVVVRYPLTTPSGQVVDTDWFVGKAAGQWAFVGNQLPYRMGIDPRLNRQLAVFALPPGTSYFTTDRFESVLRITFDPSVGSTSHVRAVRVTGPGLPAAGLVLFRSLRCSTSDRMAVTYQNGSTRVNASTDFQFFTGGSAADFVLDAANTDGSALAMPAPVLNATTVSNQNFAAAPVASQSSTIPAWSRYKFELFRFDALSDTPDEVLYVRTSTQAENAAAGAGKAWPTLSSTFIDAYLKPTGSGSGAVSSLGTAIDWTAPAGSYVSSAYLFGQNSLTTSNGVDPATTYIKRNRLDFEPAAFGDTSGTGIGWADARTAASLSSFSQNAGANPNPRCTTTDLEPLTTTNSDYREAGLAFRGADRKLYQAIWFWDN